MKKNANETYEVVIIFINASRCWRCADADGKFGSFKHCWTQWLVQVRYVLESVYSGNDKCSIECFGLAPPMHCKRIWTNSRPCCWRRSAARWFNFVYSMKFA